MTELHIDDYCRSIVVFEEKDSNDTLAPVAVHTITFCEWGGYQKLILGFSEFQMGPLCALP